MEKKTTYDTPLLTALERLGPPDHHDVAIGPMSVRLPLTKGTG